MATSISLPPITVLEEAAHDLAEEARSAGNSARERAISKAQLQLAAGTQPVPVYGAFLVKSRTAPGTVYRISHVNGCSCQAAQQGRACWHQALVDILEAASARAVPAVPMGSCLAAERARVEREALELFA
jgi:hypothetical protein